MRAWYVKCTISPVLCCPLDETATLVIEGRLDGETHVTAEEEIHVAGVEDISRP
jgi:hypothetical protein